MFTKGKLMRRNGPGGVWLIAVSAIANGIRREQRKGDREKLFLDSLQKC